MKLIILLLASLLAVCAQAGQVYKWTDKNGRVHYGDKPVANAQKIEVKPPANTPPPAPGEDAERAARDCAAKRDQLATYQQATRVMERDALGNEKEYTETERQQLIARTQQQIEQLCNGQPSPEPSQAAVAPARKPAAPQQNLETDGTVD